MKRLRSTALLAAALAFTAPHGALAQNTPAPATAPTTKPAYKLIVPPGFEKVTVGGHTAVCQSADVEWVKKGMAAVKPATRPTTMPSDLLKKVADNRDKLIKQITTDLALPDDKEVTALFDEKLTPTLTKFDKLTPPVYLLICTRDRLRELTRDGWGEPRFHYNRLAGAASWDDSIMLSIDKPMDDSVLPAIYIESDPPEKRIETLASEIQKLDQGLLNMIAQQAHPTTYNLFAQFIGDKQFEAFKLRRDQQWFSLGVTAYLSSKYAAAITTIEQDKWLKEITYEDARFPVMSKPIDLVHPLDPSAMKPIAVPYYSLAMRRKATLAVMKWCEKGDAVIPRMLAALRTAVPADGPALVAAITKETGVDLSKELAAQ